MPITGRVRAVAEQYPDRPAIVTPQAQLGYAELVADGARTMAAVASLDGSTMPVVAVSVAAAFHAARVVAGLAGYRAISAVLDPLWPLEHRLRVVRGTGVTLLISDDLELRAALDAANWPGRAVTLAEFRAVATSVTPAAAPQERPGDEPFLMLFSSGTTSAPKAFYKTRAQYRANVAVSAANLEPLPGEATLAPGPLSYSLTLYALIECLATGGSCHLADRFDALALAQRIPGEGITRVVAVPAVLEALALTAKRTPQHLAGLRLLVAGGANLPARIRTTVAELLPHARLISYYGAAEIGFIGDSRGGDGRSITLYDGIDAEVRAPNGQRLADGEIGELWIRAEAASDGYLAATTDARLRDERGWATVHDQARLRSRTIELLGRAGDIVVSGGHKVSLPEVERAFELLPYPVCAVALPDDRLGSIVALVVEAADVPAKSSLQATARAGLAPQFVPRRYYRLAELPRTVGGKVRRSATAELIAAGGAERL